MRYPVRLPLPPGVDPANLATRAAEEAIDFLVATQWEDAAARFRTAAYYCDEAQARVLRREEEEHRARGERRCSRCRSFRPAAALQALEYGYQSAKVDAPPPSVRFVCKEECTQHVDPFWENREQGA